MGIGLIFAGVTFIAGIISAIYYKETECFAAGLLGAGVLFGLVSAMSALAYHSVCEKEMYEIKSQAIYSLGTEDDTHGMFILGFGHIRSDMVYTYYIQNEDGSFELKSIKTSSVKIKESNDIEPCIKIYESKHIPKDSTKTFMFSYGNRCIIHDYTCVIYIPEGSLVQTYTITP